MRACGAGSVLPEEGDRSNVGLARLELPPMPLLVGLGLTLAASFPTHALKP